MKSMMMIALTLSGLTLFGAVDPMAEGRYMEKYGRESGKARVEEQDCCRRGAAVAAEGRYEMKYGRLSREAEAAVKREAAHVEQCARMGHCGSMGQAAAPRVTESEQRMQEKYGRGSVHASGGECQEACCRQGE